MKKFWAILALVGLLMGGRLGHLQAAELNPGDPAPDFELTGSDGKTYKLADFKGKQAVVIAWFPKAFTGGCTAECKSLRADGAKLREFEVAYFTASCDDVATNAQFAESLGLDYPILSDPGKQVAKAYGVVHAGRDLPERWTFYIDTDSKIMHVDTSVRTGSHGRDVAEKLKELGIAAKD